MVKSKLIAHLANRYTQLTEQEVEICVNQILEFLSKAMEENRRIEIRGFGSFCLHHHPNRNAHNPRTGEKLITFQKYAPHFKPGKEIRDRLNQALAKGIPLQKRDLPATTLK